MLHEEGIYKKTLTVPWQKSSWNHKKNGKITFFFATFHTLYVKLPCQSGRTGCVCSLLFDMAEDGLLKTNFPYLTVNIPSGIFYFKFPL